MIVVTTRARPAHRPTPYRVMAALFVVLYLLSSARGLVPGLCMNLRGPESTPSSVATSSDLAAQSAACCSIVERREEGGPAPQPAAPRRCPLCRLAFGMVETPEFVHFTALATAGYRLDQFAPPSGASRHPESTRSVRGPPYCALPQPFFSQT